MRAFTWMVVMVMVMALGLVGCAEKREEELPQIDPAELQATASVPALTTATPTVEVETPGAAVPDVPAQTAGENYTVQKGDGLMSIARRFYGEAGMWRRIYEANRDRISNPDLIKVGMVLAIPPK